MEHVPVTDESPVVAQYEPAEHAVHVLAPVEDENVPAKQFEQTEDDEDAE